MSSKINKRDLAENIFSIYGTDVTVHNDVAIAKIAANVEGEWIEAVGVAKRHPDDKPNPRVAALIANTRALESLHIKLQKRASGAVKHADDIVRLKDKAKKKAKKKAKANKAQ